MLERIEEEEDVQVWKSLGFSGRVSDPLVVLIYLTYYIAMGNQHFSWLGVGLYIYIYIYKSFVIFSDFEHQSSVGRYIPNSWVM